MKDDSRLTEFDGNTRPEKITTSDNRLTGNGRVQKGALLIEAKAADAVYGPEGIAELAKRVYLLSGTSPFDPAKLSAGFPPWLRDVECLFTGWSAPQLDEKLLAAMPNLKAVFYGAGSVKSTVTDSFWSRGIVLSTAVSANAVPVSEYTLAVILLSLKNFWRFLVRQHRGGPFPGVTTPIRGVYRATVGLIALGAIGRLVHQRLRTFDVHVRVYDPYLDESTAAALGIVPTSLEELFATCDVVSLHAPLLPSTEGLVGGELVRAMKPDATLVNTARGGLLREREIYNVLRERTDITAVLDVLDSEPVSINNPLLSLPNVIISPHIAGSQGLECRRMGEFVIAEYNRWISGEPLQGRITQEDLIRRA